MGYGLVTTLTKNSGPTLGRINRAYVSLVLMPERSDHSRTATLDRCGPYEVRLVDFLQGAQDSDCLFWLELYCHVTDRSLDSWCCDNFDDAETVADHFISVAKRLHEGSE
jgi:hypothetical protein